MLKASFTEGINGPVGPPATKYHGEVVPPNGSIYLYSKTKSSLLPKTQDRPKLKDLTASAASMTQNHIKWLQHVKDFAKDQTLKSTITVMRKRVCVTNQSDFAASAQDAIEELAIRGGGTEGIE